MVAAMAPSSKANYKSFEAQARLIRAIVAAHPETKWNYKEIAACYGSDMTEAALNHRFRRLRAEALIISEGRKQGFDMKDLCMSDDLPRIQGGVDKNNISKYFGKSTADGIQFQFRSIKKDADRLRQAVNQGGDVANCPLPGINGTGMGDRSAASTPSKATPSKSGGGRKRKMSSIVKPELTSDFEDDFEASSPPDLGERDTVDTPSKKRPKVAAKSANGRAAKNGTPNGKQAAPKDSKSSAPTDPGPGASIDLTKSFSEPGTEQEPPSVAPSSIFGDPSANGSRNGSAMTGKSAFNRGATDSLIGCGEEGGNPADDPFNGSYDMFDGYGMTHLDDNGEI